MSALDVLDSMSEARWMDCSRTSACLWSPADPSGLSGRETAPAGNSSLPAPRMLKTGKNKLTNEHTESSAISFTIGPYQASQTNNQEVTGCLIVDEICESALSHYSAGQSKATINNINTMITHYQLTILLTIFQ